MGVREARKFATRERVVDAARELFDEVGFEATTIRMIADRANVSVGSVFTTFDSKIDIFNHVLLEKFETLYKELRQVAPHLRGSTADRLVTLLSIAYEVELSHHGLVLAQLSASYGWPEHLEAESRARRERLTALFREILDHGVARGEVRADADLDLFGNLLIGVYLRNFKTAWYDRLTLEEVKALVERQVNLLLDGVSERSERSRIAAAG